jgi:Protein of unknown function (DUF2924)
MKRVTRSPPSKDVVSAPTFEDVARFVAGPDAPVWLVAHFKRWAKSLVVDRFLEEKQPTKVAMKRQLADVKDAALLLRRALSDTPTREFLEIVPQDRIKYGGVIDHMLQDLATRAERAMGSPDGFEYGGTNYPSLTKIAKTITGAQWSGPRFFGLVAAGAACPSHEGRDG